MSDLVRPTAVARLNAGRIEYRLDRRGDVVVVVFHGGHVRAGLALGEDIFAAAGCTVLVPSRPGYGGTPLSTGTSVERYTEVVRELCAHLGIVRINAVVGISGGGPTAATMAARHADLVERLILISAVGWLPYPDRRIRLGAHLVFAATTEHITWAAVHALTRLAPDVCLRTMLRSLSTQPVDEVVAALSGEDREMLLTLFGQMRSGRGFLNDLRPTPDVTGQVTQPTLVIATRTDGGVPFAHAQSLTNAIQYAELVESRAHSHFVWLGPDWPAIAVRILAFLDAEPTAPIAGVGSSRPDFQGAIPEPGPGGRLARAFHLPLRRATAALALAGGLLAAGTAVAAFLRLGTAQSLVFLTVAVAATGLAFAVLRGTRWALAAAAVLLGGQITAVTGTIAELALGIAASKATMLRQLGVSPTAGLVVNLAYSTIAVALFGWLARRWSTTRQPRPHSSRRRTDSSESGSTSS
jgi:pimeloyl-ACP methyl ester carboxylesterase